jgi:hypothetical protein
MQFKVLLAVLALALLAACAPQVEATIPISAVSSVTAETKTFDTTLLLRIPQSSERDCNDSLKSVVVTLQTFTPIQGSGRCLDIEGDYFSEVETALAIMPVGGPVPPSRLFILEVDATAPEGRKLSLRLTRRLEEIAKAINANYAESTDLDPPDVVLHLRNDSAASIALLPNQSFVNGKPMIGGPAEITNVAAEASVSIRLSDVASRYLAEANAYRFATLAAPVH